MAVSTQDIGQQIQNFTEQYINQSITSIEALTNGEQLSFLPLVTILFCVLNAAIRWSFWNSITIINAYPLKNFTRKPCPNLVESVLLHNSFFYYLCYNPPEGLTSMDIRNMSEDELLDLDYFLNEDDLFNDEAGVEGFYIF